ncbi:MAG: hypothetical protein U5K00_24595 [Melioribacteraceae bacterium]|nr:hypothetical protein [Melioribacteraceae bacterium]
MEELREIRNAFDVSINSDGSYLIFAQPYEDGFINNLGPLAVWKFSNNDQLVFRTDFPISKKDYFDLCRISDEEYYLSYFDKDYPENPASVIYHSIDGGNNWNFIKSHTNIKALSLEYSTIDQKVKAAYYIEDESSSAVIFSEDALADDIISTSSEIETSNHSFANTKLIITDDNKLWFVYNEIIQHTQDYSHSEILYLSSGDNGDTWSGELILLSMLVMIF